MRYSGGLLWRKLADRAGRRSGRRDFDGSHLVSNFENMNPSNTLWTKQYNVYANVDTEGPRYLGFEKWWGGHVLLNAEEMQLIVDNLFVGNKLATAEIVTRDGVRIDLRNITSPIICFCSQGDNITPPQQALGWITDLYESVDDIRANGQTIVYCIHDKIGHLGIFVSGGVAKKEHQEFASNIDFIDCLPPGLYEAVITPTSGTLEAKDEIVVGDYLLRLEQRSLDAIRALGGNDLEDEQKFATVAKLSDINLGLYRTLLQPWVRAAATPELAEASRQFSSSRLQYELVSDRNPWLAALGRSRTWCARTGWPPRRTIRSWRSRRRCRARSWLRSTATATGAIRRWKPRSTRSTAHRSSRHWPGYVRATGNPGRGPGATPRSWRSSPSRQPSCARSSVRAARARVSSARSSISASHSSRPTSAVF